VKKRIVAEVGKDLNQPSGFGDRDAPCSDSEWTVVAAAAIAPATKAPEKQLGSSAPRRFARQRSAPPSVPLPRPARLGKKQAARAPPRPLGGNSAAATTSTRYPSRVRSDLRNDGWLRSLPTSATIRFFSRRHERPGASRKRARPARAMTRAGTAQPAHHALERSGDTLDKTVLLEVMPVGSDRRCCADARRRAPKGRARLVGALLMGRRIFRRRKLLGLRLGNFRRRRAQEQALRPSPTKIMAS